MLDIETQKLIFLECFLHLITPFYINNPFLEGVIKHSNKPDDVAFQKYQ